MYEAIKEKISHCHVVLIMAGKYATFSKWIDKEINISLEEFQSAKPILGIKPWASEQVSSIVSENCDELVGWNTVSIISAIRELSI